MSQGDLAIAVRAANPGLRPDGSAVSKIERGLSTPSANFVAALATATGHEIEFFYEAEGEDGEAVDELEAALIRRVAAAAQQRLGEAVSDLVHASLAEKGRRRA